MASIINKAMNFFFRHFKPAMVAGYKRPDGKMMSKTRISNTTFIDHPANFFVHDNVFIGHHNYLEASHGLVVEEGVQITNFVSVTTHSSHISIRLYGSHYGAVRDMDGYITGPVTIGKYSFIGPHSVIMPNTVIGKGCIVAAFSYVQGSFPDFSILAGNPAKITGSTRDLDKKYLENNPELNKFYNEWAGIK